MQFSLRGCVIHTRLCIKFTQTRIERHLHCGHLWQFSLPLKTLENTAWGRAPAPRATRCCAVSREAGRNSSATSSCRQAPLQENIILFSNVCCIMDARIESLSLPWCISLHNEITPFKLFSRSVGIECMHASQADVDIVSNMQVWLHSISELRELQTNEEGTVRTSYNAS